MGPVKGVRVMGSGQLVAAPPRRLMPGGPRGETVASARRRRVTGMAQMNRYPVSMTGNIRAGN